MKPGENEQVDALVAELERLDRDLDRSVDGMTGQLPRARRRSRRQLKRIRRQIDHNVALLRSELGRARRRRQAEGRRVVGPAAARIGKDIAALVDDFAALVGTFDLIGHAAVRNADSARERAHVIAMHLNGEADITKGWPELPWKR